MARWCIAVDNARRPTSDADESSPVSKRKRKFAPSNITFTLPDGKKVKLAIPLLKDNRVPIPMTRLPSRTSPHITPR